MFAVLPLALGVILSQIFLATIIGPQGLPDTPLNLTVTASGVKLLTTLTTGFRLGNNLRLPLEGCPTHNLVFLADSKNETHASLARAGWRVFQTRCNLYAVRSIDVYRPGTKDIAVFGQPYLAPTCSPHDVLHQARVHLLSMVESCRPASLFTIGHGRDLFLSSLNRLVTVSLHLPRVLSAQPHLAFGQTETQVSTLPYGTSTRGRLTQGDDIIITAFAHALLLFCGLLYMITRGRYTKVHGSVLVTFTTGGASSFDQPESVYMESMRHSLIPESATPRFYGQTELDQDPYDELPTDDCPTDHATEDASAVTNTTAWSLGIPSLVSTSSSCSGNPASISSPENQEDGHDDDTGHETAESHLVDPATVPLPENDNSCREGYEELLGDLDSLNEDILEEFEGVPQDHRRQPMSENSSVMDDSIRQDISSKEEVDQSAITPVELTGHPNYAPDASLECYPMELGTTFQKNTVDELDIMPEQRDPSEPTGFEILNPVAVNSSGVPSLANSMDNVLAAGKPSSTRSDDVSSTIGVDILVDSTVPTTLNVTGTKGEAYRGHQTDYKQAEVLMDISRAETSGSDTTWAHLVPSTSFPSVISGSVPLARSTSLLADSDLTFTTSVSCPGLLPSRPSVPAFECGALEATDFSKFSGSQTCPNIALEAHASSGIAESACLVQSMAPVSTSLPEIKVATDELAQVSSTFTRAPLDYGLEDTPVAGCSTTSLPPGSSGKKVPDSGVNDQLDSLEDGSRLLGQDTSPRPCGKNEDLGECGEQINDDQTAYAENAAPGPRLTEASNPCQKDYKKSPSAYRMDIKLYTRKVAKFEKMVEDVKAGRPLIGRDNHRKLPWLEKQLDKARGELGQAVEGLERKEKRAAEKAEEAAARKAKAIERKAAKANRKLGAQEAEREQE